MSSNIAPISLLAKVNWIGQITVSAEEEQAQVSQEIAANAHAISDLNQQSRETSAKTSHSADELQRQAESLKNQVNFFS